VLSSRYSFALSLTEAYFLSMVLGVKLTNDYVFRRLLGADCGIYGVFDFQYITGSNSPQGKHKNMRALLIVGLRRRQGGFFDFAWG